MAAILGCQERIAALSIANGNSWPAKNYAPSKRAAFVPRCDPHSGAFSICTSSQRPNEDCLLRQTTAPPRLDPVSPDPQLIFASAKPLIELHQKRHVRIGELLQVESVPAPPHLNAFPLVFDRHAPSALISGHPSRAR
ncbi:hypothetical protein B0T21DRAFT_159801 [Apiosordaria backusii]|uniref:Uncharacterized protein n=1 Tax=Apiosordaria backusii TaxID=314023 RepID=A0AA40EES3_9PEZI|nr:hypothetical protein B0T21DRAFT_159801 [Apiosordaria backusii]